MEYWGDQAMTVTVGGYVTCEHCGPLSDCRGVLRDAQGLNDGEFALSGPLPESDASMEYLSGVQAIEAPFTGTGRPLRDSED